MRTMKQLREIATKILNTIKDEKLTLEETYYVLELIRFFGVYGKIRTEFDSWIKKELEKFGS